MAILEDEITELQCWFGGPRFKSTKRIHSAREVAEQRGRIKVDYPVARLAAEGFYERLRQLFAQRQSMTCFGPYSPGQAVAMKRQGVEGIYLGGWATSAKGSIDEDPGPDLASYPLSQVPDEAAPIVRALLTADKNQFHALTRMGEAERKATPEIDFRPFIIADADTGHGGDAHVRNLIRRFVEVGVPGYHIEDQKPGVKKCGHQGGKVLVSEDEQIKRLSSARFQLDIMGVAGIIVARTDAEAATLLDGCGDERDQPFILGATNLAVPSFRSAFLAILRQFHAAGVSELSGHQIYAMSEGQYARADRWLQRNELQSEIAASAAACKEGSLGIEATFEKVFDKFVDLWQEEAEVKTYAEAVADRIAFGEDNGEHIQMTRAEWLAWANRVGWYDAQVRALSMHLNVTWDCEHAKTPDGYYQIRGGLPYAIAKSLACAPYADLLWMETKTADLHVAKQFAEAIHAVYPDQMLAYNLSPSFNWDTTGMGDEEMRKFPEELGQLGFVFNFITYGGHQIDGVAADEFAASLKQDGMLALARLQRKLRLLESPYRTPQTLVGGPRADAGLMSISGRTATTKAMGTGSTQYQHLIQTEVSPKVLEDWLGIWCKQYRYPIKMKVSLKPHSPGSDVLELRLSGPTDKTLLNIVFSSVQDRRGRQILSVRDQNTFDIELRRKRLMTLAHLFLIHRYKVSSIHYLTPSEDNQRQTEKMKEQGLFLSVNAEVGEIIVADVNPAKMGELLAVDKSALTRLIAKV